MVEEICPQCGLDEGCDKCYAQGKHDMLKAFETQLEGAITESGNQARLGFAQRFFVKNVLGRILGELRKKMDEEMKKDAV